MSSALKLTSPALATSGRRFPVVIAIGLRFATSCVALAAAAFSVPAGDVHDAAPAPLAYEMSAYELAPELRQKEHPWSTGELKQTIHERVAREKRRREMEVYYYRIGYTMSFPLPLARRPALQELPVGIPNRTYPWLTWLSWNLEERWRLLDIAWRRFGDRDAGVWLQRELAALSGWDHFCEVDGSVGLATGHIAASLSLGLADASKWDPELLRQTRTAAELLIERDVWPWFQTHWPERELTAERIGNIPVIALVRSAQLARVIGSPRQAALEQRARAVLQAWGRLRTGKEHHTEGTVYDGYLLDSISEWMAGLPDRPEVLRQTRDAFRDQAEHWMDLTLPGRPDLQTPLGDAEPEMTFWATALMRFAGWYDWPDAQWLLRRFPVQRLRVAALGLGLDRKFLPAIGRGSPKPGPREHPNALSLRTGWDDNDLLAVVGLSRSKIGHLHADGGQLILGWQGRFWITDPGYQQYRPGEERDYTLGVQAHNAPVIGGVAQTQRAARVKLLETSPRGWQHAQVELSGCYQGIPDGAGVRRDVWLINDGGRAVVARDTLESVGQDVRVSTSWQGATHLGWAFREGWVRLSDGQRALWVGAFPGTLDASELTRHPGSRGPLTLTQTVTLPNGQGVQWWVFWCDVGAGWKPPSIEADKGTLRLKAPETAQPLWSLE